jgi:hypothetical protein
MAYSTIVAALAPVGAVAANAFVSNGKGSLW